MTQAFYSGTIGIQTHQTGMDILADNLANTNAIGFRGSNVEFSSMLERQINTGSGSSSVNSSVGVGVQVQTSALDLGQGELILTDSSTDLAIDGDGWFGIEGKNQRLYTRNGVFKFDSARDLVTPDGYHLIGTLGNNISGETLTNELTKIDITDVKQQTPLNFPLELNYPAVPTGKSSFFGNLGVSDETRVMSAKAVDSQGQKNVIKLTFTKSTIQPSVGISWDVKAEVSTPSGDVLDTQNGVALFDKKGGLLSSSVPNVNNNGSSVQIDLGSGGYGGVISTSLPITASSSSDGLEGGTLLGYDINEVGEIVATFTNGRQSAVGKVALFHFQNDQGLEKTQNSRFKAGANSGEALFFREKESNAYVAGATLRRFNLENSNVRLEEGLTEIIIMQRAYDANAKSITTADQMIQKALQM